MTDRHEHLDEGIIHAWLDGALSPDESARVESAAASCAECAALVAEARGLIAASSRILSSLDAVPAGVIPGTSANVDQLAALRARRRATSRRWWQDRRVAIAASLVFVAGVSSLVWRSNGGESALSDAMQVAADSTSLAPVAQPAPAAPTPVASPAESRQAVARDAKVAAAPQSSAPPPPSVANRAREATSVRVDSVASALEKVVPTSAPVVGIVANEVRRAESSVGRSADSVSQRRDVAVEERERLLRQEGARQAVQQFRADSTVRGAAALREAPLRLGAVVTTGVAAAMADVAAPGGTCYRLRGLTAAAITDTVRLLNQQAPVLSDPAWFRTQIYGALRDTTLAWRSIDSATVELRSRFGSDTAAVRFRTDGPVLENRDIPRIRPVPAMRIACPN